MFAAFTAACSSFHLHQWELVGLKKTDKNVMGCIKKVPRVSQRFTVTLRDIPLEQNCLDSCVRV